MNFFRGGTVRGQGLPGGAASPVGHHEHHPGGVLRESPRGGHGPDPGLHPGHTVHRRQRGEPRVTALLLHHDRGEDPGAGHGLHPGLPHDEALRGPLRGPGDHPQGSALGRRLVARPRPRLHAPSPLLAGHVLLPQAAQRQPPGRPRGNAVHFKYFILESELVSETSIRDRSSTTWSYPSALCDWVVKNR